MDKVWPFFTGVIIDAELEGTEIPSSICLAVTQTDRQTVGQNRREERRGEERRDLWSGVAPPVATEEEEEKKSGIADGRAIRSVNGGSKREAVVVLVVQLYKCNCDVQSSSSLWATLGMHGWAVGTFS